MNIPENLFYTKEHEWAKLEENLATVGITDYAQHSLGDITFIELPQIGKEVKQFEKFSTVESVKVASDVYAPFSGKIVKINKEIENKPEIVNRSPYQEGWFVVIQIKNEEEKNNLMSASKYKEYLKNLSE